MGDWLQVYNVADVVSFIEAFRKMTGQYYPDKIDVCKDAVSIPGISMTYVLKKSLEKNKKLKLYSPGGICHLCRDKREELHHCSCNGAYVVFIVKNVSQICRPLKSMGVKRQPFMSC